MKSYFKLLLIFTFGVLLSACGDNKEDEPKEPSMSADYYVKYEGKVSSIYKGNSIRYTVITDEGYMTYVSGKSFSQTYGPVKKGFEASITIDASAYYSAECDVKIYICRGSEPFALKAHNSGGKTTSVSYTIDY